MVPAARTNRTRPGTALLGDIMQLIIDLLSAYAYTPDGGVADPNHPVYILLWALKVLP